MPAPDTVEILVDLPGPQDYPLEDSVGRVWEVSINGVGYMLAEDPEEGIEYERGSMPLEPARLATSDTPFAEAIERYSFAAAPDWSSGAGQEFLHREESTSAAFWDSEGVDPFDRAQLSLLNTTTLKRATTYATPRTVVVGDDIYMQVADDAIDYSSDGTSWSQLTGITDGVGTVVIQDFTSDGNYWYSAVGDGILRGTTANPATFWSTENAEAVTWAAGRICAAVVESGSTPNRFTTLTSAGVEERTGGHLTLDAGHTIVLGGATGGNFYFGAYAGDSGRIYAWPLGLRDDGSGTGLEMETPVVAWELPAGLIPKAVYVSSGSVWVHAYQPSGPGAGEARIYRAVPSGGYDLAPFFITDIGSTNVSDGSFTEIDEKVLFAWSNMGTYSGLGAVSLETGGYAKWLETTVTGVVQTVTMWDGVAVLSVAGSGLWMESAVARASGWLESSKADGGSQLDKVWDRVTINMNPLATGESVQIEYSIDNGNTYTDAGTVSSPGATSAAWVLDQKAPSFQTRLTLETTVSSSPTVTLLSPMYHPLGLADFVLVLPVNCDDHVSDLRGTACSSNGDGHGALRARELEAMAQTRVKVQDVDWHITGQTYVYEVSQVRPVRVRWVYDQSLPGARLSQVVMLQLRRAG